MTDSDEQAEIAALRAENLALKQAQSRRTTETLRRLHKLQQASALIHEQVLKLIAAYDAGD